MHLMILIPLQLYHFEQGIDISDVIKASCGEIKVRFFSMHVCLPRVRKLLYPGHAGETSPSI